MEGISRSPWLFLTRCGLRPTQGIRTKFDPGAMLIERYPTGSTRLKSELADGQPPPNRPRFFPWTPHDPLDKESDE